MKKKNFAEKNFSNKRYKAIEKISHETDMRLKSWAIENGIYFSPLLFAFLAWYVFATIVDASLPYGEEYSYTQPLGGVIIFIGSILTFFSLKYIKKPIEEALDQEELELSTDVYQKGAKFCSLVEYNKNVDKYIAEDYKLSNSTKSLEVFKLQTDFLDEEDSQYNPNIEDIKIPRISLATGLCIMGAPGQGKSVLINQIIKQIYFLQKQIIIDVKGEFLEKHYNKETDYILCPSDIRSLRFNLSDLLKNKIDNGVIAETLIADDKQTNDPHWVTASRAVMEAILIYAGKRNLSNTSIYKMVSSPMELKKILDDEEATSLAGNYLSVDKDGVFEKETRSILSTLTRKTKILQYLTYMDDLDTEKIYLSEWLQNKKGGKLFMVATENLSKVFTPLYGVIASYLISELLDAQDTKEQDFYFILDELPRLGKVLGENLEKALAVGRSKGIKVLMAMQSYSQIKKEFGEKESESMLDTTNSFIVFKNNYGAQFLEKLFGKTTLIRNNESFSFGMNDMADRSQLQRQLVKESLIDESEITRLNKFEFYARIEGSKDVIKTKLKPIFVENNGTKRYIQNKDMDIEILVAEMEKTIKSIENKYVSFKNAKKATREKIRVDF